MSVRLGKGGTTSKYSLRCWQNREDPLFCTLVSELSEMWSQY